MSDFDTNWDPYEELMLHRSNIQQCAAAINTGSELTKQLSMAYNQQQQAIAQLTTQNAHLLRLTEVLRQQIITVSTQVELIRMQNNT